MSTAPLKSCSTSAAAAPADLGRALILRQLWAWLRVARRAAACVLVWHRRARERRHLEMLSDHVLRDIGLTRADVMAEATKRFWQR